ncbi:hypothetical protein SAMN05421812_10820 [Asanoa hainanensis]|uniref:Uncharacterized protein n=1 Tax=Asanoa hainanensis TaxID=560556 RepID=A0A239N924_9ACTN|nr:hypothetical protein [Asanoa hainanensis]SNT51426.1 hypothetical protein SAMN05421812_10820 [Asanoa hainanensis]
MELPAGATGFDAAVADEAEVRGFTTACHHAARATGGAVTRVVPAGPTPSFHTVEISLGQQRIAVLRHSTLPLVAFTDPRGDGELALTFVDHPDLAAAMSGVPVLSAGQLNAPVSQADLGALGPAEHEQIGYWRPTSVGELLFNFWD